MGAEHRASKYNIQKELEKKEQEEEQTEVVVDTSHLPKNHFSDIDLQNHWNFFLNELKEREYMLYLVVSSFRISKKDEQTLLLNYPSDTVKQKFDESVRGEFLNSFQRKVKNFSLQAEYVKDESLKQEIPTKRKIYEKMLEINPLLKDLDELMDFDFS